MFKRFLFGKAFLILSLVALAQNYPTPIVKFDENDGFKTSNYIGDVKADSEGNIWVVNFNQVSRYDGISFKEIKPGRTNHNALLRFIEGYGGQKAIIDYSGLLYFVENDTLRPYQYNSILKGLNSTSGFTDLYIDSLDRLHISYNRTGYLIIEDGEVIRPLEQIEKQIQGEVIILRDNGECFLSFTTKGKRQAQKIFVLNENLEVLDSIDTQKKEYNYPNSKTSWRNGYMYYSNGLGNLFRINRNGKIEEIEFEHPIVNLFYDSYNKLWISTFEHGVYQGKGETVDYSQVYFPKTTSVVSEQDIEGGLWVFSYEEGLMLMPYPNYTYINQSINPNLLSNVSSLAFSGKNLLMAHSGKSIFTYNLESKKVDSISAPIIQGKLVESMYKDSLSGIFWFSQRGKLFYRTNETWTSFQTSKIPGFNSRSEVKIIGYDQNTNCNIAIFDKRYFLFRDTLIKYVSPEFEDEVFTLLKQDNQTYVSTYAGVFVQQGESITGLEKRFPVLKERAHSITEFDGQVLIAIKNGGLYSLKKDELKPLLFQGLPIENAYVIKVSEDSLWCFASQGSFLFQKGGTISGYEKLPEMVSASEVGNEHGFFWSTWNKGVFYTPFSAIMQNKLKPVRLKINDIRINGVQQSLSDGSFEVSYNKNFVQIAYQPLTYKNWPVVYRYKMTGLNDEWISSTEKVVQFTALPIGEYQFQLQAKMGDQIWSEPIQFKFVVHPPIWREWWFIALSVLTFCLIVYWAIAYRFKIIKREKDLVIDKLKAEQRALRAQMDPHFVFNVVASAQYLVMKEENEKAIEFLNMFSRLMRSILDHSNSNLISLEQEIKFLDDYISLERFRLEKSFDYQIDKAAISDKLNKAIPPFIIQPFIENAIHHGLKNKEGEKNLNIDFQIVKNYLLVHIIDNGIGRKNAGKFISEEKRKRKSHGIRIIRERLELHNDKKQGNVIYRDPESGGTEVTIKIKLD